LWSSTLISKKVGESKSMQHVIYHPQHKRVAFLLNNSLDNKLFIFKIQFENICTIIPFLACSLNGYLRPIVLEFYHVPAMGQALVYSSTNFPNLSIIFPKFSHNVLDTTQTTTSFNCMHPLMCVHTSHWPYGCPPLTLHPWQWAHWDLRCNSWHFCCHCVRCWLPCGTNTTTCTSFNHIQFLPLTSWHCAHQK